MADVKKHHVHRARMTAVHDHCPDRAYIELEVPQDAAEVVSVTFTSVSRDQGEGDRPPLPTDDVPLTPRK